MASCNFNSLDKDSWYFGKLTREECQDRLLKQKHGTFLVRDSKSCAGDYVLSVSENSSVSHYIINKLQNRLKIGDQVFNTLPELLEFYKVHYLDTTTLIEPVSKKSIPYSENKHMSYTPGTTSQQLTQNNVDTISSNQTKSLNIIVKALFDFRSDDSDDLPFSKGELLEVIEKPEENWWNARNAQGQVGQIPVPYIEVQNSKRSMLSGYNQVELTERIQRRMSGTNIDSSGPVFAQVITRRVPNAYDPTALALEVGDIIKVTKMSKSGQWEGECKQKHGWFPFTHVRIIDEN